jgi:hypothetical protein
MFLEKVVKNYLLKRIGNVSTKHCGTTWSTQCGSAEEWNAWDAKAKELYPKMSVLGDVAEWLDDVGSDIYRYCWRYPKNYLCQRFINRSHLIKTGLEKGCWHEPNERILHGVMQEAKRFMEGCDVWACQKTALEYLRSGKKAEDYTCESEQEQEFMRGRILALTPLVEAYLWWKNVYPIYEVREKELYDQWPAVHSLRDFCKDRTEQDNAISLKLCELEDERDKAIVENLKKVVSTVHYMWD